MSYSSESLSPPRPVALGRLRLRHPGRTTLLPTVTLKVGITAGCLTQAAPCSQPSQSSTGVTQEWLPLVLPALLGGHAHCQTSGFKSSSSGLELFANIAEQQILAAGPSGWSLCPLADQGQDWGMCCPGTGTIWAMISSCWYLPRLRSTAICGPCWLQEHESMLMGSGGLVGGRVGPLPQAWAQLSHLPPVQPLPHHKACPLSSHPHLTSSPWPPQSWWASALIPGLAGIGVGNNSQLKGVGGRWGPLEGWGALGAKSSEDA